MIFTFTDAVLISTYFILLFLAIFWLLVFLSSTQQIKREKLNSYPMFTAIVPAKNEESSIETTLQSLYDLDYPRDKMEIIVSVNGSTDNTLAVVKEFIGTHRAVPISVISHHLPNKGAAMNRALLQARGEFFACLDADSYIHQNALMEMLPYFFADKSIAAVCPVMKVKKPGSILQKVQWCEYIINMFHKFLNSKLDAIHVTPGPFSVYRTAVIKEIGLYDEKTITEDLEIALRLQKHNYRIIQMFDAIVETTAPKTWRALFKQRVRWYKGSIDNSISYRKLIFNKKYGDFGIIEMPAIILSGAVALLLLFTLLREASLRTIHWLSSIKAVNFDLITLLKNYSWNFNVLTLPVFKIVIAVTLLGISFFVMINAYKLVKEDIRNHGRTWIALVTYLFIYSLFMIMVWAYIAFLFLTSKKNSWS